MSKKAAIVILDGWGLGNKSKSDAVFCANTPFTDSLTQRVPHATLRTDGENVGLPEGQMGNSEVGHMNIGAGRVVWQMLAKINKSFRDGEASENGVLQEIFGKAIELNKPLHLFGLVSDGGVHAHIDHLLQLCRLATQKGVKEIYIHAFLDGRDTDPKSGHGFLKALFKGIEGTTAQISTVVGRYFAMDRDLRWERVKKAYDLMVHGLGEPSDDLLESIENHYLGGETDEFMSPIRCLKGNQGLIKDGDVALCFNFRTDRGRQLTRALSQEDFHEFNMHALKLEYYTLTQYDEKFNLSGVVFENDNLRMTLGEVLESAGKSQLRAAETEKYPHVTFFFSGGREQEFKGESRIMASSPKVATYDLQPEMSAVELTDKAIEFIGEQKPDFVCLNYANADMVGHTGVYSAIVKAVETVDTCLESLIRTLELHQYQTLIIADHGNADFAINEDGTPNTAHTTNPVPIWLVGGGMYSLSHGKLADVAPTVLDLMGIKQAEEMTGQSLLLKA